MSIVVTALESYGERLKTAITFRKIKKLYNLADELGVSESAISRWVRSEPISLENFTKLCVCLNINADWLLFGRGGMEFQASEAEMAETLELLGIFGRLDEKSLYHLEKFLSTMLAKQAS